jgi:hypothetical protein
MSAAQIDSAACSVPRRRRIIHNLSPVKHQPTAGDVCPRIGLVALQRHLRPLKVRKYIGKAGAAIGRPKGEGKAGPARHLPEARWYVSAPVASVAAPFEIACVMPSRHQPAPTSREPEEMQLRITCGLQVWAHRVAKASRGFSAAKTTMITGACNKLAGEPGFSAREKASLCKHFWFRLSPPQWASALCPG